MTDTALALEGAAVNGPAEPEIDAPVLAMPEGWVIDDLVRERLARQLARAPSRVRGVVAGTGELPPGASYRVHAERLCMQPLSDVVDADRHTVRGAALLRPDVAVEVHDDVVEVESGELLADPGAHVHDPWRPVAPLEDASSLGRPPFPRRPVIVFLACEPEVEALDWARSLVNNLVRRDVEGRLAMLEVAEGLHLTQPCLPSEKSIRALRPDVVVALDKTALQRMPVWCQGNRSAVAVELVPDVAVTHELVSWQLGRAQGRLRARIGRQIDAPGLVSLLNRLCSGPHPAPPTDAPAPSTATRPVASPRTISHAPTTGPITRRSVIVVTEHGGDAGQHPLDGLVDHLVAAGHRAQLSPLEASARDTLRDADLVVVESRIDAADVSELIETRRQARCAAVASVEPSAWVATTPGADREPQLAAAVAQLAIASGNAITGSSAVIARLRALGVRAHLLPPLLTRAEATKLRSARRGHSRFSDPVIGWHIGYGGAPPAGYATAVAEALLEVLEQRPDARLETVGAPSQLSGVLHAHSRVSMLEECPRAERLARWAVQVWSPPLLDGLVADDTRAVDEAAGVGVPTVLPEPARTAIAGHSPPGLVVAGFDRADEWIAATRSLLDSESARSRLSEAAARRFDTMHSSAASALTANRFLGWAVYGYDSK